MAENPYKRKKFEAGGELNKSTGLYGDGGGKREGAKSNFRQAIEDRKARRQGKKDSKARAKNLKGDIKSTKKVLRKSLRKSGVKRKERKQILTDKNMYKVTMTNKAVARGKRKAELDAKMNKKKPSWANPVQDKPLVPNTTALKTANTSKANASLGTKFKTPTSNTTGTKLVDGYRTKVTDRDRQEEYKDRIKNNFNSKKAAVKAGAKSWARVDPNTGKVNNIKI
mgnify:CR=1 FL=1